LAELLNLSSSLKPAGQDAFAMVYSSKTDCWSRVDFFVSTRVGVVRSAWQKTCAKKPQQGTLFDETIQ